MCGVECRVSSCGLRAPMFRLDFVEEQQAVQPLYFRLIFAIDHSSSTLTAIYAVPGTGHWMQRLSAYMISSVSVLCTTVYCVLCRLLCTVLSTVLVKTSVNESRHSGYTSTDRCTSVLILICLPVGRSCPRKT